MNDKLRVGVVGGLGLMASPMAVHWKSNGPVEAVRVHDRGGGGERRERNRKRWIDHGARLVDSLESLVAPDLDGLFVCCGKNGEDAALISSLARLLSEHPTGKYRKFICHLSTVSTQFTQIAAEFCTGLNVDYANYPLTGGAAGAENGTMLILASGPESLFARLKPSLSLLGVPKYFGPHPGAGAEVKFIGHLMVFNGLMGICSAAATHAECFQSGALGGSDQVAFFDFINTGAGGTKQWDLILSRGLKDGVWDAPFSARFAAVDVIYTAQLCMEKGVSYVVVDSLINLGLAFSYVLNEVGPELATHSIVREMIHARSEKLDAFMLRHSGPRGELATCLEKCIRSFPKEIAQSVALDIQLEHFT